jgi:hypothetical protein
MGTKVKRGESGDHQVHSTSAEQPVELPKVVHSQTLTQKSSRTGFTTGKLTVRGWLILRHQDLNYTASNGRMIDE